MSQHFSLKHINAIFIIFTKKKINAQMLFLYGRWVCVQWNWKFSNQSKRKKNLKNNRKAEKLRKKWGNNISKLLTLFNSNFVHLHNSHGIHQRRTKWNDVHGMNNKICSWLFDSFSLNNLTVFLLRAQNTSSASLIELDSI